MVKMKDITKQLESTLGPDTTDLGMRIGLHSGPVTVSFCDEHVLVRWFV